MLVIGGLVQFGMIFWTQNTITQISRDTARYAVTLSDNPCHPNARPKIATAANTIALNSSLISYSDGTWSSADPISGLGPEGVGVDWDIPSGFLDDCPPSDNALAVTIHIQINHVVPIFLPGLQLFAPACSVDGFCLTTQTNLRMEPKRP
jgi:hypothetical protein